MHLLFACPPTGRTFTSDRYRITNNRGVRTGPDGRRVLEAQVELTDPCPWCGLSHIYRAPDLPCPPSCRLGDQPSHPRE